MHVAHDARSPHCVSAPADCVATTEARTHTAAPALCPSMLCTGGYSTVSTACPSTQKRTNAHLKRCRTTRRTNAPPRSAYPRSSFAATFPLHVRRWKDAQPCQRGAVGVAPIGCTCASSAVRRLHLGECICAKHAQRGLTYLSTQTNGLIARQRVESTEHAPLVSSPRQRRRWTKRVCAGTA